MVQKRLHGARSADTRQTLAGVCQNAIQGASAAAKFSKKLPSTSPGSPRGSLWDPCGSQRTFFEPSGITMQSRMAPDRTFLKPILTSEREAPLYHSYAKKRELSFKKINIAWFKQMLIRGVGWISLGVPGKSLWIFSAFLVDVLGFPWNSLSKFL